MPPRALRGRRQVAGDSRIGQSERYRVFTHSDVGVQQPHIGDRAVAVLFRGPLAVVSGK
ncbi:Uncharacterised protein [Mycobacteroides abscessus subsp. massiliense]|nr:Uncharacterised protein [Mycobacteroides abscessus subsp. massiliense]